MHLASRLFLVFEALAVVVNALPAQQESEATVPDGFTVPATPKTALVAQDFCGIAAYKGSFATFDLWKNDRCFDLVDIIDRVIITNPKCGLCVFWNNHDCTNPYSDSAGPGDHKIADSMSFYCIP